jgi:hypothetical protein
MPRQARIDAPGALHRITILGIERRMILTAESERENFLERLSNLLTDSQTSCYAWELSIPGSEMGRRFKQDGSAVSRAVQQVDNDPKLMTAATTIMEQLEREAKQPLNNVSISPPNRIETDRKLKGRVSRIRKNIINI